MRTVTWEFLPLGFRLTGILQVSVAWQLRGIYRASIVDANLSYCQAATVCLAVVQIHGGRGTQAAAVVAQRLCTAIGLTVAACLARPSRTSSWSKPVRRVRRRLSSLTQTYMFPSVNIVVFHMETTVWVKPFVCQSQSDTHTAS